MTSRIALTGATGFVGSFTARALLDAGHRVRAFVRNPEKAQRVLGEREGLEQDAMAIPSLLVHGLLRRLDRRRVVVQAMHKEALASRQGKRHAAVSYSDQRTETL